MYKYIRPLADRMIGVDPGRDIKTVNDVHAY